ncbi:MAG TPA: condensation domain-containing protein, partial [Thermoanaerobaculia bacterium]|nr:condensation domain-containing protein [Thermoanaerobaculia bacterium]
RLFDRPTVAGLAAVVESARGSAPTLLRAAPGTARVLSYAQERLWFLEQLEPGRPTYNVAATLRLRGSLAVPALLASLGELARRHEVLRTRFAAVEGLPYPMVDEPSPLRLPLVDLTALPGTRREPLAALLAAAEAQRPFDLATGPLLRVVLLRLAAEEHAGLVTLHHIVCDGWSQGVLIRELSALYGALCQGRPSPLPELQVQYADYARWQREWLLGGILEGQVAYWRERLAGAPRVLELPTDRPRPAVRSGSGGEVPVALPARLAAAVGTLGRQHGATLFMVLLAGWDALLSRYSGQQDLLVGSPIANRTRLEVEGLIGFFINTLVLRGELAGASTFGELLGRVRAATLGAFAHQDLPFERLIEELAPERDASRTPLFQVVFALQNAPRVEFALPGLVLAARPSEVGTAKFDLTLTLGESAGGLAGELRYSRDLFDPPTLERLAGHLGVLLEAVVADPTLPLAALPLLTPAEAHQLAVEWNDERVAYPAGDFVHQSIAARAARTPDAVAVLGEGALTYGELVSRAERLARHLRHRGVGPEGLVGISAERSAEMVVGLLGILGAGGAYLPLDASYPRERLAFMLADAGVRVLLTQRALVASLATLPTSPVEVVVLDEPAGWRGAASGDLRVGLAADHPAYVIYTSGSTGQPKGVVITHRSLANRLGFHAATDLAGGARLLQKTSISFDVSLLEIFGPLLAGGCMVLCRPGEERDVPALARRIAAERITHVTFPPSMLSVLLDDERFQRADSLEIVVTGSEAVPSDLPGRFHGRLSAELWNRYGPTECTIAVTAWKCRRGVADHPLPIGRPIARAEIHLLDAGERPVPVGV